MKKFLLLATLLFVTSDAWAVTLYAKAAGGNWSAAGTWSNVSSAGGDSSGPPASGDDVIFDAGSGSVVVDAVTNEMASLDMNGYLGTLSGSASILVRSTGTKIARFGGTVTHAGAFYPSANSGCSLSVTFNGVSTFTTVGVNNAASRTGTVTFLDGLTIGATRTLSFDYGTLKTDGAADSSGLTHSWGLFSSSNSNTRVLTLGTSSITISGASAYSWDTGTATNLTITSNTATITLTGASSVFRSGTATSGTWNNLVFSSAATSAGIESTTSFANVTKTGAASKTDSLQINSSTTITGTLTLNGNSSTNRLHIKSNVLGTSKTLTAAAVSISNADFRDIIGAGAASWNLSAITGLSGNCGGNSNITFTTSQTNYWVGGTGNWSDVNEWASSSGGAGASGRVPLPQDHARFDASSFSAGSQTVTADMPRLGTNIDWTGATNSPTWSANTVAMTLYGDLKLISGMTFTTGSTGTWAFEGRGTHTITMAGKSIYQGTIQAFGGTYSFADAINVTSNTFSLANGTLNFGSYTHSFFDFASSNANTRTINLESSTISLSRASTSWNCVTATNLTLNAGTSEIRVGSSVSGFAGGGKTYNNVRITASATTLVITGANTFNRIYTDGGGTKSITLPGSTTTTIISGDGLGNGTNVITFTASSGSATVAKSGGGTVGWDYVNLTNIPASTANTWYAGTHSTDGGGNTNWSFTDAPPSGSLLNYAFPYQRRSDIR